MDAPDFDAQLKAAWDDVRGYLRRRESGEATAEDDPQPSLAATFFEYYTHQKDSELGRKALATAFAMWGNSGCAEVAGHALTQLDVHSADWTHVLDGVGNAYWRCDRQTEYASLLLSLKERLTHPRSLSAVHGTLGRHALRAGNTAESREHYGRVIELQADPFMVMDAQSALYELDALQPGQHAPDFHAVTINGDTIQLAELRERVVLLDFWATDCAPCWREFPHLRALHGSLPESDFALIGISQDREEERLREVLKQESLAWSQSLEPTHWRDRLPIFGPVTKLYNVWSIPRTVLVDRKGMILAKDLRGDALVTS
jgi:peroxiredoxin